MDPPVNDLVVSPSYYMAAAMDNELPTLESHLPSDMVEAHRQAVASAHTPQKSPTAAEDSPGGYKGIHGNTPKKAKKTSANGGMGMIDDGDEDPYSAFRRQTKVTQAELERCRLEAEDGAVLDSLMNIDLSKEEVSAKDLGMDSELACEMFEAIGESAIVTTLDLSYNLFCERMMAGFTAMVTRTGAVLSTVNLSHCDISDDLAGSLFRGLRRTPSVRSINLSCNPFGDGALPDLCRLLESNTTITEMLLADTKISCEGCVPLVESMLHNFTLLYFTLPFTLGHALLQEVNKILRRNWLQTDKVRKQVKAAQAIAQYTEHEHRMRNVHWRCEQPLVEARESRLRNANTHIEDWTDVSTRSSSLFLALLDKKSDRSGTASKDGSVATVPLKSSAFVTERFSVDSLTPRGSMAGSDTYCGRLGGSKGSSRSGYELKQRSDMGTPRLSTSTTPRNRRADTSLILPRRK